MSAAGAATCWGPRLLERGVEFRLWAPSANALGLDLELGGGWESRPMRRAADGWWFCEVPEAGAGCRYRYRVDDGVEVPDPASRFQPEDCHGPSQVVDPAAYRRHTTGWRGRPWQEAVIYELHPGTFTPAGTFAAAIERLDTLVELGITAVELMPVADFRGRRNWGYDGVLPFAPDHSYGTPEALVQLVDAAHGRGLMVFLDVVYNHFGPEGNYLGLYAKPFFTHRHRTPWGDAVNFDDGDAAAFSRAFFIENALYWLEAYGFDGLRLDAVHAICDDSDPHILTELARRVRAGPGRERLVHLVLENDANESRWLSDDGGAPYDAQWNDDFHHAAHVIATGERDSYYGDYVDAPLGHFLRTLIEGFAFQGEFSRHRGARRGEPSAALPATAFVTFLQNHDQIGNRAFGERLHELTEPETLEMLTTILLLAPMPPLLFMGQEWCASSRFPFFCDFEGALAAAVQQGRMAEFAQFPAFRDPQVRELIPDPVSEETFAAARLDWNERLQGDHGRWWTLHQALLALRRRHVLPLLERLVPGGGSGRVLEDRGLEARWRLADGGHYVLHANLDTRPFDVGVLPAHRVHATPGVPGAGGTLPPRSAVFSLDGEATGHD
ncbi:MAG: malto-oligosyltrehalose trehalohydrolase [Pseudomonadota bacterium]